MKGGLVHLNGCSLFHKKHLCVLYPVCIVPYLPGMSQYQHEIRYCNVNLASFVVFKSVVGRVPAIAVSYLDVHPAVEAVPQEPGHLRLLHFRNRRQIDIAVFRNIRPCFHI